MVDVPFGLSPDQLQAIGLVLVGIGLGLLTFYFRDDVTHLSAMLVVLFVFCGASLIGYGSALTAVDRSRW